MTDKHLNLAELIDLVDELSDDLKGYSAIIDGLALVSENGSKVDWQELNIVSRNLFKSHEKAEKLLNELSKEYNKQVKEYKKANEL